MELEEGKLRVTLIKAVVKATSRAGELLFDKLRAVEQSIHSNDGVSTQSRNVRFSAR
jgi:hypothetical protein